MRYVKSLILCAQCFHRSKTTFVFFSSHESASDLTQLLNIKIVLNSHRFNFTLLLRHPRKLDVFIVAPFTDFQVNHCQVHFCYKSYDDKTSRETFINLNFKFRLSHDTFIRQTTLKHRPSIACYSPLTSSITIQTTRNNGNYEMCNSEI